MSMGLEFKSHSKDLISIKVFEGAIDISDKQFNDLFNKCIEMAEFVYFRGERANYESDEMIKLIESYSDLVIFPDKNIWSILCRIPIGVISISRKGFKNIWDYYEYPALYFIEKEVQEEFAVEVLKNTRFCQVAVQTIKKCLVVSTGIENDVLWVWKSEDMNFPDYKHSDF